MRTQRQGPNAALLLATAAAAALLLLAAAGAAAAADASAPDSLLNAANVEKAVSSFMQLVKQPYSMQSLWGVSPEQVQQLGVGAPWVQAAADARSKFRESLLGDAAAGSELAARLGNGTLLPRLLSSGMPLKLSADGKGIELPGLQAIGVFLSQRVQEALKGGAAGLAGTPGGRRLLEVQDNGDDEQDTASGDTLLQVLHNIERIRGYMARLATAAGDALDAEAAVSAAQRAADGEFEDDEGAALQGSQRRRLQQPGRPLGGPLGGLDGPLGDEADNKDYGDAIRLIFTNIFDLFRANGLYALVPIIADLRGIFTRYNFIADLFNILDAPLENFVNANYWPLPQSNDDFIELVRKFAGDYCSLEEASSSEDVLGEFEGPSLTYEVAPVSCPIYADPVTGRSYVSFADCDPAKLTISVSPLTITEAYYSAASYTGAQCKLTERFGTDLELSLGGGARDFTFRRTAQGLTITPTVIQWNSDFSFFPNLERRRVEDPGPTGGTVTVVAQAQEGSEPDSTFFDPPPVGGDAGGGGDADGADARK